jgi:hypothetical protein
MRLTKLKIAFLAGVVRLVSPMVAAPGSQLSPKRLNQVRRAMVTTTESGTNITQAYNACEQWDEIMVDADNLPENIRGICYALQASTHARLGQDALALDSYRSCLKLKRQLSEDTIYDATMGKAFALQRLMKYNEASLTFLECDTERACIGAVTCLLRLDDVHRAEKVLCNFKRTHQDSIETEALLGILLLMRSRTNSDKIEATRFLSPNCDKSPLYRFAYAVATKTDTLASTSSQNSFDSLDLASVNQSPFDDPMLIHLDDKIYLHKMLTNSTQSPTFWPKGFVLPHDMQELKIYLTEDESNDSTQIMWILKQRAGYGSHGNTLVSKKELMEWCKRDENDSEAILCQKLVAPPLLLNGHKFSIRVYVVYFPGTSEQTPEVHLSDIGLVKLASLPFEHNAVNDDRIHMTNSGREAEMSQCDLNVLKSKFDEAGWSYRKVWTSIRDSVLQVMQVYLRFAKQQQTHQMQSVGKLGIPKILGFDYIVDANRRPFLLEVNRFPGLEPRDANDTVVKRAVVLSAWALAYNRLGLDAQESHRPVDEDVELCSFERLIPLT